MEIRSAVADHAGMGELASLAENRSAAKTVGGGTHLLRKCTAEARPKKMTVTDDWDDIPNISKTEVDVVELFLETLLQDIADSI